MIWVQDAEMNWGEDLESRGHMTSGSWLVRRVCGRIRGPEMGDIG